MQNRVLSTKFGVNPTFSGVMDRLDKAEHWPEIKTFFSNYRNPIGIEVEVEGITEEPDENMIFWGAKEDGSLRNRGKEYVSAPLVGRQIDYALYELEQELKRMPKRAWSHRTSIHVHQNMAAWREQQLKAYIMVYGLFEPLFYSMAEPYRQANSFCYPATNLEPGDFMEVHEQTKYCGLNLYPLRRYGTVEWRQMSGTEDFRHIRRWIQLIVKLHAWVDKQASPEVVENVVSYIEKGTYLQLFQSVFGANAALFSQEDIEASGKRGAMWSLCISTKEFS